MLFLPVYLWGVDLEERVATLEERMGQVSTETPNQTFGANFAPENFQKGWIGLFLVGEVLYWHPKIGGTEYAYNLLGSAIGWDVPASGDVEDQDFDWGWGARAGLGLTFPSIGWEIICTGTWYRSNQTDHHSRSLPSVLINLRGASFAPSSHVRSRYDLSFSDVLLELKKPYFLSRFLSTALSLGVKWNWVDQEQKLRYRLQQGQIYQVEDLCHFQGVGPRIGFNLQWHLFLGLSLLGEVGGALLYGDFDVKHEEKLTGINEVFLKGDIHLFSPEVDFNLGLGWDLYTKGYHLGIALCYEALYMWRQNEALKMEDITAPLGPHAHFQVVRYAEDLTFYGVTLKAKIEF